VGLKMLMFKLVGKKVKLKSRNLFLSNVLKMNLKNIHAKANAIAWFFLGKDG
jgi:hypothetical protein